MRGRLCRLELLDAATHAHALHEAYGEDTSGQNWTYLPYGPFASADAYAEWVRARQAGDDPIFYAILLAGSGRPVGVGSYLRIDPEMGSLEVGSLCYSPALQRSAASTEAMYLMMRRAFDELGYRRYEWKCDSLNAPSRARRRAARLPLRGHVPADDGHQARSRDSAWYSILDTEWPALRNAFERWLAPDNFDANGAQRARLEDFR
jgi:RimJ/RimL family protein N-acetyltransferase